MAFVPAHSGAPVTLAVVAYGATPRLRRCIEAFAAHDSATDFEVVCVANPDERRGSPDLSWADPRIEVLTPEMNLGWAGGLHLARTRIAGPYMVWVQDDMVPRAGWLDALVAAAEDNPRTACLGSLSYLSDARRDWAAGGRASPARDVRRWPESDVTRVSPPRGYTEYDWVTSKGMLVRTAAWDDVGGADPRIFPLGRVDMEFCTHARTHGWKVALVPKATISHLGSRSAPGLLRAFLSDWRDDEFDATWGDAVAALAADPDSRPPHPCSGARTIEEIERACAIEATRALVPFGRHAVEDCDRRLARYESSKSWRWTAPLRSIVGIARRLARR